MAIVFAPNLFDPSLCVSAGNPAAMFKANELVSTFFRVCIEWRAKQRQNNNSGNGHVNYGGHGTHLVDEAKSAVYLSTVNKSLTLE